MEILFTQRLNLIPVTPEVINELFSTCSKEEIMNKFGFDDAGFQNLKSMNDIGMVTHRLSLFFFIIQERQKGIPIGECGFHSWNALHHKADLFYLLRKDSDKQKGYMTEALLQVLNFGFTKLNLHRVQALAASWNIPSVKLLQRYGFTKEGTLREDYLTNGTFEDSDCYSLLKQEWKFQ
jgi:ribosomal-protein-alanine N-acetyltransferase